MSLRGDLSLPEGKVIVREAAKFKIIAVDEQGSVTELQTLKAGAYAKEPDKTGSGYNVTGGTGSGLKVDIGSWSDQKAKTTYNLTNVLGGLFWAPKSFEFDKDYEGFAHDGARTDFLHRLFDFNEFQHLFSVLIFFLYVFALFFHHRFLQ